MYMDFGRVPNLKHFQDKICSELRRIILYAKSISYANSVSL